MPRPRGGARPALVRIERGLDVATTFNAAPLVFLREHAHGPCYAFPLGFPAFVARGDTAEEALEEQRFFLSQYLGRCPAGLIADALVPHDANLHDAVVVLPRPDLRQRLRIVAPVTVPCLVVPDGRACWVSIIALGETIYVKPTEVLADRVRDEIRRAAATRALTPEEYLAVLPTPRHRIVRLPVEFTREDAADAGPRAARRRQKAGKAKDNAARKLLAKVGTELLSQHKARRHLAPVLGRDREIKTLGSLLSGPERLSVMLVGEPMTGKTAVLHGLLSQTTARFSAHPVFATSGAQLVAGQSGFGQLQQRIDEVMTAAERVDAVLYFDDYADLFAGHSGNIEDIASMMRPWIADNRVRVVGELSPDGLEHHEKRHVAFFAAMHRITIEPADAKTTRRILDARIAHQRKVEPHRPQIAAACVEPLVELAERYLPYQAYPGKCVRLAQELRAVHESEVGEDGMPRPIGVGEVYRMFSIRSAELERDQFTRALTMSGPTVEPRDVICAHPPQRPRVCHHCAVAARRV